MNVELLFELIWKSMLAAGLALLLIRLLRSRSAAEKSLVAHLGVLALVLLPLLAILLPSVAVHTPAPIATASQSMPVLLPTDEGPSTAAADPAVAGQTVAPGTVIAGAYVVVALLFLAGLAAALVRLWQIRSRAELLDDPVWLSALVAAQRRVGSKNGTALLVSKELDSPVSWGVLRPTIIVDASAAAAVDKAETIIAHELAHVLRLDWLRLILGRIAIALFWLNPLVWMLVRRSHQLAEEAADDAVLCTRVPSSDYAELLLRSVQHAHRSALLAANGVAPSRSSLSQRVRHVLDRNRPRQAVRLGWGFTSVAFALSLGGVLAAVTPASSVPPSSAVDRQAGEKSAAKLEQLQTRQARAIGRAIRERNWDARRVPDGTTFNEPAARAPLVEALSDDEADVRAIAVWGLSEMRPELPAEAAPAIAGLLGDASPRVRSQAARALGESGSASHARAIASMLADPVSEVRIAAAHALGDLQLPSTRAALESARGDPDPAVRAKVNWALGQVAEAERILRRGGG